MPILLREKAAGAGTRGIILRFRALLVKSDYPAGDGDIISSSTGGRPGTAAATRHGGSIRAALAVALGIEAERALAFTIDNCSLTRLDHIAGPGADDEGQWRINAVNLHPRLPRLG